MSVADSISLSFSTSAKIPALFLLAAWRKNKPLDFYRFNSRTLQLADILCFL